MKKKKLDGLDLTVFEEKLDNGLNVYIVPMEHVKGIYATLSVDFGGDKETFIPIDGKKMVKMPRGIAHFIEHQLFNQKDGSDIFAYYSERGTSCNANTRNNKTTYLFSGVNFLEDNINKLLDFVFEPYFTDESVSKEKGIIEEEIRMYDDDPYAQILYHSYANVFKEHPLKAPLIGTKESINKISKEDLYTTYKTFYQPSNMYLIVTGNIDPKNVIEIVKENQKNKKFSKPHKIVTATYNEPDKVVKRKEVLSMKVSVPKVAISFKININKIKNIKKHEILSYLTFIFDTKLGPTSLFLENLKKDNVIIDNFYMSYIETDMHVLYLVQAETEKPQELTDKVLKEMQDLNITEQDLERRRRVLLSYQILASENIYQVNLKLMNNISKYGCILYDAFLDIKNMNMKQFKYVIKNISLENYSVLTVEAKK